MSPNRYSMLVVEDNDGPRQSLVALFEEDLIVHAAKSGEEALSIMRQFHETIVVAVVDLRLDGADPETGLRCARVIRDHYAVKVVVFSAYIDTEVEAKLRALNIIGIDKPNMDRLREVVMTTATVAVKDKLPSSRPMPPIPEGGVKIGGKTIPPPPPQYDEGRIINAVDNRINARALALVGFLVMVLGGTVWTFLYGTVQANAEDIEKIETRHERDIKGLDDRVKIQEQIAVETKAKLEGIQKLQDLQDKKLDAILGAVSKMDRDRHRHDYRGRVIEDDEENGE